MNVLLLRHAESEWNRIGRWQGTADPPLSDDGRRDAALMAPMLERFATIWASPLSRAAETAAIIADVIGVSSVRFDDRLVEVHFADWQGLSIEEIDARWPELRLNGQRPPGAETDEQVGDRALAALANIADEHDPTDGPVLVVTHGGVMRTMGRRLGHPLATLTNLGGVWLDGEASTGWRVSDIWQPAVARAGDSL